MEKYSMLYPRSTVTRRVLDLNGMWKFRLDKKGEGDAENWKDGIPIADWIPVPASFNDFYTDRYMCLRNGRGATWMCGLPL